MNHSIRSAFAQTETSGRCHLVAHQRVAIHRYCCHQLVKPRLPLPETEPNLTRHVD